jgi:hypothetical protein
MTEVSLGMSSPERPVVTTIEAYANAFTSGEEVAVQGLCGRILRGTQPEDFSTLTDDPQRKVVMLMGSDGLEQLPGKPGYDMLATIGYTDEYIARKIDGGTTFKLIIFPESKIARPATWSNMLDIVSEAYPDVRPRLLANSELLQAVSFATIQAVAGYRFAEVDANGPEDDRYMTYDRYAQSGMGVIATRAFLYHCVHMRDLFRGDGYTSTPLGERGVQEYAIRNERPEHLGNHILLDLPDVTLP